MHMWLQHSPSVIFCWVQPRAWIRARRPPTRLRTRCGCCRWATCSACPDVWHPSAPNVRLLMPGSGRRHALTQQGACLSRCTSPPFLKRLSTVTPPYKQATAHPEPGPCQLQERGDRHAAFWACPPCDCAFPSSSEFAEHLYTYHEEAVYADEAAGTYLTCSHCGQEVGRRKLTGNGRPRCPGHGKVMESCPPCSQEMGCQDLLGDGTLPVWRLETAGPAASPAPCAPSQRSHATQQQTGLNCVPPVWLQVVGAYYRSPAAAGFQLCTRCNAAAGGAGAGGGPPRAGSSAEQLVCIVYVKNCTANKAFQKVRDSKPFSAVCLGVHPRQGTRAAAALGGGGQRRRPPARRPRRLRAAPQPAAGMSHVTGAVSDIS
jgi:hypothetical protein